MTNDEVQKLLHEIQQVRADFSEQLAQLRTELQDLKLQIPPSTAASNRPIQPIQPSHLIQPIDPIQPMANPSVQPPAAHSKRETHPIHWEGLVRAWLPRIFILVLLIGVVFGFVAAVKAGYLTEPVRCALGYAAGVGFIWLGGRQFTAKRQGLGQVFIGGGVSLLVLSTFAANLLYHLMPATPAFALDVGFLAMGVYFSLRHNSETLAVLSSVGSFLVPFLVQSTHPNTLFFVAYETLCSMTFLYYSVQRNYRVLFFSSLLLLHGTFLATLIIGQRHFLQLDRYIMAGGLIAQHCALLYSYLVVDAEKEKRSTQITLFSSMALTVLWWDVFLQLRNTTKWMLLGFFLIYVSLLIWQRTRTVRFVLLSAIAAFILMLYINDVFNGANEAAALLLEGSGAVLLGLYLKNRFQLTVGSLIYLIGLLLLLKHPLQILFSGYTGAWIILLITMPGLRRYMFVKGLLPILFWFESVLLLIFITEITNVLTIHRSIDIRHLTVSSAWIGFAVLLATYGILRESRNSKLAGVVLLFVTLAKLVIVDIPSVSVFIRAVLFIALGGVGLLVSRLFYRKEKREDPAR